MGTNPKGIEEDFDHVPGDADIHFMLDVLIRNAVVHFVDRYMIIELYGGDFPGCQLVWGGRQR